MLISVFIAAKTAELHPANWSRPLYNYYQHLMANNWYEISCLLTMNGGNIWEEPEVHRVTSMPWVELLLANYHCNRLLSTTVQRKYPQAQFSNVQCNLLLKVSVILIVASVGGLCQAVWAWATPELAPVSPVRMISPSRGSGCQRGGQFLVAAAHCELSNTVPVNTHFLSGSSLQSPVHACTQSLHFFNYLGRAVRASRNFQ